MLLDCLAMNHSSTYSEYDSCAWFYNLYWGDDFARPAMAIYETLLFPQLRAGAAILDLCCGTGQLAAALDARGFRVTGVDGSPAMLAFARANAPEVEFVLGDVRELAVTQKYAAVISAFDSLNHLMALAELKQVFRHVFAALEEPGIFLFDLNLETEDDARKQSFDVVEADHSCVVEATYDKVEKLKQYRVTMSRQIGKKWQRNELNLRQRYYTEAEVIGALAEVGFKRIRTYDAQHEFDMHISDGRMFFRAQKAK